MNIILVGMMGSGKTTLGKKLAQKLHWNFVDTDQAIEKKYKTKIADIFQNFKEEGFRKLEQEMIQEVCRKDFQVISTGGGAVCSEENWKIFRNSCFQNYIIWFDVPVEILWKRLFDFDKKQKRPLLNHVFRLQDLQKILDDRKIFYERADWIYQTDSCSLKESLEDIYHHLCSKKILPSNFLNPSKNIY